MLTGPTLTVRKVLVTAGALWLGAQFIGGIQLTPRTEALTTIGTVLVVALLFAVIDAMSLGLRRLVLVAVGPEPLPLSLMVLVALNAGVLWLTGAVAAGIGLGFQVNGVLAAVLGALLVSALTWVTRRG